MIDNFTVLLPHLLMALAIWRLLHHDDLDSDPSLPRRTLGWQRTKRLRSDAEGPH
ncbi:hypothetical protein [Novosphingobium sp.]|uniref:hypothetical protein n=1 Tax=Novosphingobium sp. TaxID=1874826 RepID=UPI0038B72782